MPANPNASQPRKLQPGRCDGHEAKLVVHAEPRHHIARDVRSLIEIVGRPCRCLIENQHLGGAPAQQHRQSIFKLAARKNESVLGWPLHCIAKRANASWDHGNLVNRIHPG
jgi:hypothetical protein